ncbi:MAG: hypothetical protein H0V79_10090, partial [Actinobacteria bacterium]|nr:hypothetical protein [Actinomycetota bacterium]
MTVANAAVVRRDSTMGENPKAVLLEPAPGRGEQPDVLEAPPRKRDGARLRRVRAGFGGARSDRFVKGRRELLPRPPVGEVVVDEPHEGGT